ncbi:MAG: hypothetical protein NT067_06565 [Candidatus Diapherotrites archaeon]|nr:hypothetical protein [Candidatus Diapherotrites archaeon]
MFVFLFGFGKGKMEMTLKKFNFTPGEKISGHASLQLNKPVKARAMKVVFWGERTTRHTDHDSHGTHTDTHTETIYSFELPLDGEKEYSSTEYDFEIAIPGNLLQTQAPPEIGGAVGAFMKTAMFLAGPIAPPKWFVQAKLDIPGGMDVSKKVQVNIT